MTIETADGAIADALYSHADAAAVALALPIVYPNPAEPAEPPAAQKYLRCDLITAEVEQVSFGGDGWNRHEGTLRIFLHWPRGEAEIPAREAAGKIARHFKNGTDLHSNGVTVRVIQPPTVSGSIPAPNGLVVPVLVRWISDIQNPA